MHDDLLMEALAIDAHDNPSIGQKIFLAFELAYILEPGWLLA